MMDPELVDSNISVIASALEMKIPEPEIVQAYVDSDFEQADIFLLMAAAKIIYHDRNTAVKQKPVFRRVTNDTIK